MLRRPRLQETYNVKVGGPQLIVDQQISSKSLAKKYVHFRAAISIWAVHESTGSLVANLDHLLVKFCHLRVSGGEYCWACYQVQGLLLVVAAPQCTTRLLI